MQIGEVFKFLNSHIEIANTVSAIAGVFIAAFAFTISLVSVFFTWRTLKHQRRHNRMSVLPIPYITVGDYEHTVYVKIRNTGTGPLIVKSLSVVGGQHPEGSLEENMPELQTGVDWTDHNGPSNGRSVAVGGEIVLLELSDPKLGETFKISRDLVRNALGELSLVLNYTDVYGSKFEECSRDLKWFHRILKKKLVI
jgi:hypothetical protein